MTRAGWSARTLVAIVGLLALAVLFAALGAWQLRRADESRATQARFAAGGAEQPLRAPPDSLDAKLRFSRLEVRGTYAPERQFLLDNRIHEGMAGYEVLTPFLPLGSERWLLVNRGWLPAAADRRVLPDVRVAANERTVAGRLDRLPRPGLRLGEPAPGFNAVDVAVVQYPTAAELEQRLGAPLYDYELLLDADAPDGFVRDWRAPGIGTERHLMYAGQWLLLCLGAFGAAVVIAVRCFRSGR